MMQFLVFQWYFTIPINIVPFSNIFKEEERKKRTLTEKN